MPAAIAIPLITAAASSGAAVVASRMQASSANKGAKLYAESANRAAEIQGQGADKALGFQQQQAARDQSNFERAERANYEQWAARERRVGQFGDLLGLPQREVPGYVPSSPQGGGQPTSGGGQPTSGGGDPQAFFQSLVQGKPATPETLTSLEPQLNAKGIKVLRNAAGVAGKIEIPGMGIVDVGQAFSSGNPGAMKWQWLTGSAPGASGTPPGATRSPYVTTASTLMAPRRTAPLQAPVVDPYMPQPWQPRMR